MSKMVCLSDTHFGDEGCVLNNRYNSNVLIEEIGTQTDGKIDTLILNGDIWEQCIPDLSKGYPVNGFAGSTRDASQNFFDNLFREIIINKIVTLFGNHDLTLGKRLFTSVNPNASLFYTSPLGIPLSRDESPEITNFLDNVFPVGRINGLTIAYPNYIAKTDFPIILFHHGHLLDTFVLGWENAVESKLVQMLKIQPSIVSHESESMKAVAENTEKFILKIWTENSEIDRIFWNDINRRLNCPKSCPWETSQSFSPPNNKYDVLHRTSSHDGMLGSVPWYLDLALTDPELPSPVGSLKRDQPIPDDFKTPSCFVFGHDHLGSKTTVIRCGVPFVVVDSAGWTSEHKGHYPHTHFLVWDDNLDIIPRSVFVQLDS